MNAAGPTGGTLLRPSDGAHPKTIVFVQCVGSRCDGAQKGKSYCSKICCMYTVSYTHLDVYKRQVRSISGAYIALFRSTPLLVQLSIIYFGLFGAISIPRVTILGFADISRFIPGVVALALNSSAYVAEIFRAGILAVDKGQTCLLYTSWTSWRPRRMPGP